MTTGEGIGRFATAFVDRLHVVDPVLPPPNLPASSDDTYQAPGSKSADGFLSGAKPPEGGAPAEVRPHGTYVNGLPHLILNQNLRILRHTTGQMSLDHSERTARFSPAGFATDGRECGMC